VWSRQSLSLVFSIVNKSFAAECWIGDVAWLAKPPLDSTDNRSLPLIVAIITVAMLQHRRQSPIAPALAHATVSRHYPAASAKQ